MSRPLTPPLAVAPPEQVLEVQFDEEMDAAIDRILTRYPTRQAALLPLLWMCQERWGWISTGMVRAIGEQLGLSPAYIEGVVTFYTMYQRQPPGRYLLQVCTTLSCQLCGTSGLVDHIKKKLAIDFGGTTTDGRFTLVGVECLGACGEAPVVQINNDYHVNLTVESLDELLDELR